MALPVINYNCYLLKNIMNYYYIIGQLYVTLSLTRNLTSIKLLIKPCFSQGQVSGQKAKTFTKKCNISENIWLSKLGRKNSQTPS